MKKIVIALTLALALAVVGVVGHGHTVKNADGYTLTVDSTDPGGGGR